MSNDRIEAMIFNYETTSRSDYRNGEIKPLVVTKYKEKGTPMRSCPTPLKDLHTMSEWKVPYNVPFTLFWSEYKITNMNPSTLQTPHFDPIDHEREQVQKTRPRVVLTPALSLDDTEGMDYQLLQQDTYTTTYTQATREQGERLAKSRNVVAPLPPRMTPSNPIRLPKLEAPFVSPEWRMRSASSDRRACRTYADSTRDFWLARKPQCIKCDESAAVAEQRRNQRQMSEK